MNQVNSSLMGNARPYAMSSGKATPTKRTRSDNMMTGGKDFDPDRINRNIRKTSKDIARGVRQARSDYKQAKRGVESVRAKIRKLRGNDEGYSVTHSEGGRGGMEFTEHYRDYDIARRQADKYERKGMFGRVSKN
jgi:hypothetical protein